MAGVPLAKRVVEVIADRGKAARPRFRYGSGCVVAERTVLTAAHVVEDAVAVIVRDPDKVAHDAALDPDFVGDVHGPGPDLALVEIIDASVSMPALGLAGVDRESAAANAVERCHVIGYPAFMEQVTPAGGQIRETVDAVGYVPVLSRLAGGLLSVQVSVGPRPLPPYEITLAESEWSGMSGAPVVADGLVLGVVSEHASREGPSSITATPLTALEADPAHPGWGPGVTNPSAWWARLGRAGAHALTLLPARRAEPAYRATIRAIHKRTPRLGHRERELSELAAFATSVEGYRWLVGGPWVGKTALVAETVTRSLPSSVDAVAYFLSRREADADSNRFLAAVVPQLAYLLDKEPPFPDRDQFRDLWDRATDRASALDRHLLLVVDGLDEDLHPDLMTSVAMLLPAHLGSCAHVLVTSRPHYKPDISIEHPLDAASPVPLDPFPGAERLATLARQEIDDLLHGDDKDIAADILGVLTAAAGALAIDDLATLTANLAPVTPAGFRHVHRIITESAARSLQPVGDRYQFAHSILLEQAQTAESLRVLRHPDYRRRIHSWADKWREAAWPDSMDTEGMTPRYLLDEYPATLADQPQRLAALLNDLRWVAAVEKIAGSDRLTAALITGLNIGVSIDEVSTSAAIKSTTIQRWLFRRIIDHIHDPDVSHLAPGALIVRRITPDVIRYILAEPLRVDMPNRTRAREVFDECAKEVMLFERKPDDSLGIRPAMRSRMLPLFRKDDPYAVEAIHSRAVAYYRTRSDILSRGEELYHRLCLGDSPGSLDLRWQTGVEEHLASSLDELPPVSQTYLALRLGIDLAPE